MVPLPQDETAMAQTRKPRGVRATREGLQKLQQAKAEGRDEDGKPLTYERIAEKARVDKKTVERFFRGEAKDRDCAIAIVKALDLDINEVVDPKEWNPVEQTAGAINWREVCGKVLAQQQENQRLRRQATERGFELNVYVPLGLVERKQQQRRRGDVPLEQVYQLTEEVITKEYDNDKFLTQVIEPGKSRRIAIIGEPGAGKTTLQEKIAVWIHDNNKGLPICIPLGGLQGKSLEDYLLQIWLKAALRFIEPDASGVEARHIASLQKLFREGKVWLLLDGVDEMAATSPVEALATIQEQLTDWLVEARVVLTCRLNVWDANVKNLLTGFETYRTLEFKPEQVEDFIRQWFTCAEESQQYCSDKTDLTPPAPFPYEGMGEQDSPLLAGEGQGERFACASESQRGEELLRKLQEPGRERIRELVRNPLRLSLLCQTSYVLPVDEPLPETKAALYERFTRYFYEWKQEQHLDLTQQDELIDELHEALGKLALAGINSAARFRLGRKLARQEMGERLFNLACRLGWLNLVDREAKTDEAVYAFFHPTFQEYFAACAIDDWHFFLNHVPDNPIEGTYRIFDPQWKEVILLWLGREDILPEQKETFITALLEFRDECGDIQGYVARSYFLAAAGIAEFRDYRWADEIVAQIVKLSFGYFNIEKQSWVTFPAPIARGAKVALLETDPTKAVAALVELIGLMGKSQNEQNHMRVAEFMVAERLEEIDDDPEALAALNDPTAMTALADYIRLLSSHYEPRREVIEILGQIGEGNPTAIAALVELINNSQNKSTRSGAVSSLYEIYMDNHIAITALVEFNNRQAAETIGQIEQIDKSNPTALVELINNSQDEATREYAVKILGQICKDNPTAITTLVELIGNSQDDSTRWNVAYLLEQICKDNPIAITPLIELINNSQDDSTRGYSVNILGRICKGNPKAITALIELINNSHDEFIHRYVAEILGKNGKDNTTAITALIELINNSQDEATRKEAAYSLGKIGKDDPATIDALSQLIFTCKNQETRTTAIQSLGLVGKGNQFVVATMGVLIMLDKSTCDEAAKSLQYVLEGSHMEEAVVTIFKNNLLNLTQNLSKNSKQIRCCEEVLLHCAQIMPYPSFYQAWHQPTTQ